MDEKAMGQLSSEDDFIGTGHGASEASGWVGRHGQLATRLKELESWFPSLYTPRIA